MTQAFAHLDASRLTVGKSTNREHKAALGQFLTPYPVAQFMASLFTTKKLDTCRLLDPGAGLGALMGAFIERWMDDQLAFENLDVTAFEIDERLRNKLSDTIKEHWSSERATFKLIDGDFIEQATLSLLGYGDRRLSFTHAILNPPYKKISSDSKYRHFLRKASIETVNLYSGFLGLVIRLMEARGEVVAIVPRSFCNGPYYRSFRDLLLEETAIRHIHLFTSRTSAFKDDGVLQENVILLLEKNAKQENVTISTSTNDTFVDMDFHEVPFSAIVQPGDTERFIHIPILPGRSEIELSPAISCSLTDIGIQVSTGPIVDFRVRPYLRAVPEEGSVPLIYPGHFVQQHAVWPRLDHKKPNALMIDSQTERWLYPSGFYTVVRRFSSKEETRRIVANTVSPKNFSYSRLGFENHLNVFHEEKHGLDEYLSRGLTAFLNSTAVDMHFRRFNGHTQVNATDLRTMKYPNRDSLIQLGRWSKEQNAPTQHQIDQQVRKIA